VEVQETKQEEETFEPEEEVQEAQEEPEVVLGYWKIRGAGQ